MLSSTRSVATRSSCMLHPDGRREILLDLSLTVRGFRRAMRGNADRSETPFGAGRRNPEQCKGLPGACATRPELLEEEQWALVGRSIRSEFTCRYVNTLVEQVHGEYTLTRPPRRSSSADDARPQGCRPTPTVAEMPVVEHARHVPRMLDTDAEAEGPNLVACRRSSRNLLHHRLRPDVGASDHVREPSTSYPVPRRHGMSRKSRLSAIPKYENGTSRC